MSAFDPAAWLRAFEAVGGKCRVEGDHLAIFYKVYRNRISTNAPRSVGRSVRARITSRRCGCI